MRKIVCILLGLMMFTGCAGLVGEGAYNGMTQEEQAYVDDVLSQIRPGMDVKEVADIIGVKYLRQINGTIIWFPAFTETKSRVEVKFKKKGVTSVIWTKLGKNRFSYNVLVYYPEVL